ncbi:hypothetical protein [Dictyobacter arantiisoli]|nr:hypothetical protein [Dictyobacter arantiisoli]
MAKFGALWLCFVLGEDRHDSRLEVMDTRQCGQLCWQQIWSVRLSPLLGR